MANYQCYLLTATGRVTAVENVEAESDKLAIAEASRVSAERQRKFASDFWEGAKVKGSSRLPG